MIAFNSFVVAFHENFVDDLSGLDARRHVMDSWDAKTRELLALL